MDRGIWTLRCQKCRETFEVELKAGERIIQYAREAACPHCQNKPDGETVPWHHITTFKNT